MAGVSAGCHPTGEQPTGEQPTVAEAEHLLARLQETLAAGDRPGFDALVAGADISPDSPALAETWWQNLAPLRVDRIGLTRVSGPLLSTSWDWAWHPHGRTATDHLGLTLAHDAGQWRLAGAPGGEGHPTPLWWQGPSRLVSDAVAGGWVGTLADADIGDHSERWHRLAVEAATRLEGVLPAPLRRDHSLLVELPADEVAVQRRLQTELGDLAALTTARGGAPSVVVNPDRLSDADDEPLITLLCHEAVHALTGSSEAQAPLWLVEGIAEYWALGTSPESARAVTEVVLSRLSEVGYGPDLPADEAFHTGDLALAYARAWLACRALAELSGEQGLVDFAVAAYAGDADRAWEVAGVTPDQVIGRAAALI